MFERLRAAMGIQAKAPGSSPASSDPGAAGQRIDVVLGLDLGTSCTKVVIGDRGLRHESHAVPLLPRESGLAKFLLPTRVGREPNLKLRLMDTPGDKRTRDLMALYLASVMRWAIQWFLREGPPAYRQLELEWSLSLGFPGKIVNRGPLAEAYMDAAGLAAACLDDTGNLDLARICALRQQGLTGSRLIPVSRIRLYPEIAAQLAGYINSPFRLHGNLLLIDVGAGTVDVSTIILHPDGEREVCSFHFCEIDRLGTVPLLQARVNAMNAAIPNSAVFTFDAVQDGVLAAPDDLRALLRPGEYPSPRLTKAFKQASEDFAEKLLSVIIRCLSRFRVRQQQVHDKDDFDPWPTKLRYFLTGGGSRMPFYRDLIVSGVLENRLLSYTRWHRDPHRRRVRNEGLERNSLMPPNNLMGFPGNLASDFDRLSVAHGLAYGGDDLMDVTASTCS